MTKYRKIYTLSLLSISINIACAGITAKPYNEKIDPTLKYYSKQNFKKALNNANKLVKENENTTDHFLSLLERGKIALAKGNYKQAIKDLQKAEKRFLRIENTISINEELGSFFSNNLNKEYETDPHETILISPYLAISYLLKGDFNSAKIERNRTINKINQYIRNSNKQFLENPFARYISAIIYEMENKYQDANIEYNAIAKYTPRLLNIKKTNPKKSTNLVIFIDIGLSPHKYEAIFGPIPIIIAGTKTIIRFAYPKMKKTPSIITNCTIFSKNIPPTQTKLLYDLENTIIKQFKASNTKREKTIFNRVVSKVALSIAGQTTGKTLGGDAGTAISALSLLFNLTTSYMEKADLRQWKTLPKNIQFARIYNLKPGKQDIIIQYNSKYKVIKNFNLKKNQINILYAAIPL